MTLLARLRALCACLLALLPATAARAILPDGDSSVAAGRETMLRTWMPLAQEAGGEARNLSLAAADPAVQAFRDAEGGTWAVRYDLRTGTPSLVWGSGLPWLPGKGNGLAWSDLGRTSDPSEAEVFDLLEQRARDLMTQHPGLFQVPGGVSVVRHDRGAVALGKGDTKHQIVLGLELDGVQVQDAYFIFRVSHGNLVQFGSMRVAANLAAAPTRPVLSAEQAIADVHADLALLVTPPAPEGEQVLPPVPVGPGELVEAPVLRVIPLWSDPRSYEGVVGRGVAYRLAWRVSLRLPTGHETWVSHRDAISGERLTLFDLNRYACPEAAEPQGRVTGGVYLGPIEDVPESVRGMPWARVENNGDKIADYNGLFPLDGAETAATGLDGRFFNMNCVDCNTPAQMWAESASGQLAFGFGGPDENGNGYSTSAERNCYYHLNVVRQLAGKNLDDADTGGYIDRNMPANVNIDSSCNAFFDGNSVNFFRSSGACNNTGEIADVMQHEWGHGLDFATLLDPGSFEGARSEGLSDVVAFLSTHDPNLGPYFRRGNPAGIRNADEATGTTLTVSNIVDECPGGGGASGGEVHCEGVLFSQLFWHLTQNMIAKYGETGGWYLSERLFFQSLPLSDSYLPDRSDSVYDAVVLIDDDDGNLANGVPNANEINEAFVHHEVASLPLADDAAECTPPVAPVLTVEKLTNPLTDLPQVRVTWPAVADAVQYEVVRNDAGAGGDVPVALVFAPATEFLDDNVTDGVTYDYRVTVFDAAGCFSVNDNQAGIDVEPVARFALASFAVDDSGSMANANGIAEPGETVELPVEIRATAAAATGVFATLSTLVPGVTVLQDTVTFRDIASDESVVNREPNFRVAIDASVPCGQVIPFVLEIESDQGCTRDRLALLAGTEGIDQRASDDFETDQGWVVDPYGTDDAATGIWVREDPNGTGAQPGEDTTEDGVLAWITGNGVGGGDGFDDVDDGCTTLQSPVFALGAEGGLVLSYQRAFSIAAAMDDELEIDISNDGGTNWLPVERLSSNTGGWQLAQFGLDALLGEPADRVVLRLRACDTGDGTLFEAALDDVAFGLPITTCEDPVPTPRLRLLPLVIGDDMASGGFGNGNGILDAGEVVRLIVETENVGNALAQNVTASVVGFSAPPMVDLTDPDTELPDVAPETLERSGVDAQPHFEIDLPRPGVECAGGILVDVVLDYEDVSGNSYQEQSSTLLPIGVPGQGPVRELIFETDWESAGADAGWTSFELRRENDWHFGQVWPGPDLRSDWDPPACHSGDFCWGNDLGGNRDGVDWNGNYRARTTNVLQSPSFDLTGRAGVRLGFWRWLTVESGQFDQAFVQVNGVQVWVNPPTGDLIDTEWVWQEIDISEVADDNADVSIVFGLNTDGGLQRGGWTIDGLQLLSRYNECEGARGCEIFPAPAAAGPVLRASGVKDLDGAEFEWPDVVVTGGETFRLYRGDSPDLVDTLVTPPDHPDLRYDDRTAGGALHFYQLRLADCDGVEGP
jgi:hypothetical protein